MVTVQVGEDLRYVKMHQTYGILITAFSLALLSAIYAAAAAAAADQQHNNKCWKHAFQRKPSRVLLIAAMCRQ